VTLKSKKLTAKQLKKIQKDFNVQVDFTLGNAAQVPALANGAIVNRPQMSLIGEAGAEAVIPLTRPARALALMEQSGLASIARQSSATVSIQNATFVEPIDAQLLAAKVMAAEKSRSFAR
jgi:SLT domain-containing protein